MLEVQFGQASDLGKVRPNNEDAAGFFIPPSQHQARALGYLFAVADGVSGLDLGEVASSTAISVVTQEFAKAPPGASLRSLVRDLVQSANAAVHDCGLAPDYAGKKMATTLVACALRHDGAVVAHVGDSRCYLVRGGIARQVTRDHTLANVQLKIGLISAGQRGESDARHVLVRSLGPEMFVAPETTVLILRPGDILVLSTDGLHDTMSASEIASIVSRGKSAEELASDLVARAVEIDGGDNVTAQVIRVCSVERRASMPRGLPYRLAS
jgi:serine/threonine protein phosphatase PrpC